MGRYILINFHIMILSMKLGMLERQSKPFQKLLVILKLINFF